MGRTFRDLVLEPNILNAFNYREARFSRVIATTVAAIAPLLKGVGNETVLSSTNDDPETNSDALAEGSDGADARSSLDDFKRLFDVFLAEFQKGNVDSRKLLEKYSKRISTDREIISYVK